MKLLKLFFTRIKILFFLNYKNRLDLKLLSNLVSLDKVGDN